MDEEKKSRSWLWILLSFVFIIGVAFLYLYFIGGAKIEMEIVGEKKDVYEIGDVITVKVDVTNYSLKWYKDYSHLCVFYLFVKETGVRARLDEYSGGVYYESGPMMPAPVPDFGAGPVSKKTFLAPFESRNYEFEVRLVGENNTMEKSILYPHGFRVVEGTNHLYAKFGSYEVDKSNVIEINVDFGDMTEEMLAIDECESIGGDSCYLQLVKYFGLYEYCEEMTSEYMGGRCYFFMAEDLGDPSYCEKISDEYQREACLEEVKEVLDTKILR